MRLIAISDVHEKWNALDLPQGDVLIVAGDLCERRDESFAAADKWLTSVKGAFAHVVYVPGNHDANILRQPQKYRSIAPRLLEAMIVDETVEIAGLRLHATPWETDERKNPEARIPDVLDVLVTHEPPFRVLDWSPKTREIRLGNAALRKRVDEIKPRLHIFGHCHMAYGTTTIGATTFVNVSICGDEQKYYAAAHPPTVIDIDADGLNVEQWR